jgi:hypothetical protein
VTPFFWFLDTSFDRRGAEQIDPSAAIRKVFGITAVVLSLLPRVLVDATALFIRRAAGRRQAARRRRVTEVETHPPLTNDDLVRNGLARIIHKAPTATAHLRTLAREIGVPLLDVL